MCALAVRGSPRCTVTCPGGVIHGSDVEGLPRLLTVALEPSAARLSRGGYLLTAGVSPDSLVGGDCGSVWINSIETLSYANTFCYSNALATGPFQEICITFIFIGMYVNLY